MTTTPDGDRPGVADDAHVAQEPGEGGRGPRAGPQHRRALRGRDKRRKAVVWHGVGDVRVDDVRDPQTQESTDVIVEITTSALCGTGPVWLPDSVSDDSAIMLSDIYPTAWFGCRLAEVSTGDTVLVLGAGPVGQLAVTSAFQQGAGRMLCVDGVASRLERPAPAAPR